MADQLGSTDPRATLLQVLSESVEVRQGVSAIDPLGLEAVLPPPGDQLGQRSIGVDVTHAIAPAHSEAGQVSRG